MPNFEEVANPKKENNTFDEQFGKREQIKVAGGMAEVADITPENLKDAVPVFLAPSWACDLEVYEPTLKRISEEGRRAISLNHPRGGGDINEALRELGLELPENLPKNPEELRKALNILGVLAEKGIEKTDVISHSEGSLNTVIAAMLCPEKFRNIAMFAPAGLIGEDTLWRLLKGFAAQGQPAESMKGVPENEDQKKMAKKVIPSLLKYVGTGPLRSAREANDLSKSQIHEALRYLHEKGIGIVVAAHVDDPVFPMDKIQETVKADMLDGFLSLAGGHGAVGEHPEMFIPAAEKMFEALEKKKLAKLDSEQEKPRPM